MGLLFLMELPLVGYGTLNTSDTLTDSMLKAISCGYKHIDTAEMYASASAVKGALTNEKTSRKDLFISSKLSGLPFGDYKTIKKRTEELLLSLGVQQVDLLLIHWPGAKELDLAGSPALIAESEEKVSFLEHIENAWQNMIQLQSDGLTRFIGVSNFYQKHLDVLLNKFPDHIPYANQIYVDFFHTEEALVANMKQRGIRVIGYRPIAFAPVYGFIEPLQEKLTSCAKACAASSVQQFILAYLVHQIGPILCSSSQSTRIEENIEALQLVDKITADIVAQCKAAREEYLEMVEMYGAIDEHAVAFKMVSDCIGA